MHKSTLLIFLISSVSSFFHHQYHTFPASDRTDDINHLNPNYTYPEVNVLNKTALNIPYPGQIFTGYITVNKTSQSKIFYVVYSAGGNKNSKATVNDTAPVILWLQGGPGCADFAAYFQNGPFNVLWDSKGNPLPVMNGISWNDEYHLIYIDSPVGVGYSVAGNDLPTNSMQNAFHINNFIVRFFELYPSLKKQDFYILGDSYAGHYIPVIAVVMLQNYSNNGVNLKGIGIGDGFTDPLNQVQGYADSAYSMGIIDTRQRDYLLQLQAKFVNTTKAGDFSSAHAYLDQIMNYLNDLGTGTPRISIYNVRNSSDSPPSNVHDWLNSDIVKKGYGADPSVHWQGCSDSVDDAFVLDFAQSYASNLSYILTKSNIRFLHYNGQDDLLVNPNGVEKFIASLNWSGIPYYLSSSKKIMKDPSGYVIGTYQNYKQFTFAIVNKAGHSVPQGQPWSAKYVIDLFIKNKWGQE